MSTWKNLIKPNFEDRERFVQTNDANVQAPGKVKSGEVDTFQTSLYQNLLLGKFQKNLIDVPTKSSIDATQLSKPQSANESISLPNDLHKNEVKKNQVPASENGGEKLEPEDEEKRLASGRLSICHVEQIQQTAGKGQTTNDSLRQSGQCQHTRVLQRVVAPVRQLQRCKSDRVKSSQTYVHPLIASSSTQRSECASEFQTSPHYIHQHKNRSNRRSRRYRTSSPGILDRVCGKVSEILWGDGSPSYKSHQKLDYTIRQQRIPQYSTPQHPIRHQSTRLYPIRQHNPARQQSTHDVQISPYIPIEFTNRRLLAQNELLPNVKHSFAMVPSNYTTSVQPSQSIILPSNDIPLSRIAHFSHEPRPQPLYPATRSESLLTGRQPMSKSNICPSNNMLTGSNQLPLSSNSTDLKQPLPLKSVNKQTLNYQSLINREAWDAYSHATTQSPPIPPPDMRTRSSSLGRSLSSSNFPTPNTSYNVVGKIVQKSARGRSIRMKPVTVVPSTVERTKIKITEEDHRDDEMNINMRVRPMKSCLKSVISNLDYMSQSSQPTFRNIIKKNIHERPITLQRNQGISISGSPSNDSRKFEGLNMGGISKSQETLKRRKVKERKKLLSIGINYSHKSCELGGAVSDANDIRRKFGRNPLNYQTRLLIDQSGISNDLLPTKKNILNSLEWLLEDCQSGDILFLYFAGCSVRVSDIEGCGTGEDALAPCDFGFNSQSVDNITEPVLIYSDEVHNVLKKHLVKGVHLRIILDCSSSSTLIPLSNYLTFSESRIWDLHYRTEKPMAASLFTRNRGVPVWLHWSGTKIRQRTLDTLSGSVIYRKSQFKGFHADPLGAGAVSYSKTISASSVFCIHACRDNQDACELEIDGNQRGLLTFCLLKSMEELNLREASVLDVFETACQNMHSLKSSGAKDYKNINQEFILAFSQSTPPFKFLFVAGNDATLPSKKYDLLSRDPIWAALLSIPVSPNEGLKSAITGQNEISDSPRDNSIASSCMSNVRSLVIVLSCARNIKTNDINSISRYFIGIGLNIDKANTNASKPTVSSRSSIAWSSKDTNDPHYEHCEWLSERIITVSRLKTHKFLVISLWRITSSATEELVGLLNVDLLDSKLSHIQTWLLRGLDGYPTATTTFRLTSTFGSRNEELTFERKKNNEFFSESPEPLFYSLTTTPKASENITF